MELHNKSRNQKIIQIFFYLSLIFVFAFFYRISSLTPLAGDDWGYAINGMHGQPFKMAFDFYFSWSGRFFSELYGFLVTPHKAFWNILNALLFTSIFYNSLKISRMDKSIVGMLLLLFLMFSVKDELRMETYTWLMGTTYVIPLALSLFYFNRLIHTLKNGLKLKPLYVVLHTLILFYIGLTMENIAVVMVFANICLILYSYVKYREIPIYLYNFLFISILSFVLLRLSPGASARLIRDHQDWLNLSIFDQILINYPNFIRFTFIEHRYLVLVFSGLNILLTLKQLLKSDKNRFLNISLLIIFVVSSFISISLTLSNYLELAVMSDLVDYKSLINLVFWPIFILAIFTNILSLENGDKEQVLFFILLAGLSNGVMMASPIFGFRSSLYTVYFMIIASLVLLKSLAWKWLNWLILIPLFVLLTRATFGLNAKYKLVERVHEIRLGEITYYRDNPDVKEAWLIRYPIYSIHSGDIEKDDPYHMQVFKEYYELNQDVKLIFYYPENGYDDLYE